MALFRIPLMLNKDISFWKLLGSGKNGTFDIHPDWRQWGLLIVNRESPPARISRAGSIANRESSIVNEENKSGQTSAIRNPPSEIRHPKSDIIKWWWEVFRCEKFTIVLQPIEGHGTWDGEEVFGSLPKQTSHEGLTAVLTRATIRISKLKNFWKNVDGVAKQMSNADGFITSIGIGEVPWIKQATFSLWKTKADMIRFAYKTREHAEVIHKTRNENWYSEDMFVRFIPLAVYGSINGKNPLEGML